MTAHGSRLLTAATLAFVLSPAFGGDRAPIDPGQPPSCGAAAAAMPAGPEPTHHPRPRILKVAVDGDFAFRRLFPSRTAAEAYLVDLYARASAIYERELGLRIEVSYLRVWDEPDPYGGDDDPLQEFRGHWNQTMGGVERHVTQLVSGRRDLWYGGIAYIGQVCTPWAYSVIGYVLGEMPETDAPDPHQLDLMLVMHEIGHNLGTGHSHDYGINGCQSLDAVPARGTIMSYCSQTVSGGNMNTDLRFHAIERQRILAYLSTRECLVEDCNFNGLDDRDEIAAGLPDVNADGVPDECQDCDGDGELDPVMIAFGLVPDLDGNGVPDACDPDCDGDGMSDAFAIAFGLSADSDGDRVPDECESDCDGDGVPDHDQIRADMTLDLDRNGRLDVCADCDGDGIVDRHDRGDAGAIWIASRHDGVVRRAHGRSGAIDAIADAEGQPGRDLVVDARRRRVLVSMADRVAAFAYDGTPLADAVVPGLLVDAAGLAVLPGGDLIVADFGADRVHRLPARTGATAWSAALAAPHGVAVGPDGLLYVTSDPGSVVRLDLKSGALVDVVVPEGSGDLLAPRGLAFLPKGDLLVTSSANRRVNLYRGGTGAFVRQFNRNGTDTALTLDEPWGVRIGPRGNVFVSRHGVVPVQGAHAEAFLADPLLAEGIAPLHINSSRIFEFDAASGNYVNSTVIGNDTGLWRPSGFDFLPLDGDRDLDGVPDGCGLDTER